MTATDVLTPKSPWDLIHQNMYVSWTGSDGPVTAHFDDRTERVNGDLLVGTYVDSYGWWHKRVVLDFSNLPADLRRVGYKEPEDAPFEVSMRFEWRRGCIRLVIPDDDVRRLVAWKRDHWTEIPGVADGYSAAPRRGSWEHRALSYLHSVQSHTTDSMPFIEGVGFGPSKDEHGNRADYGLLLSCSGISRDAQPNGRFYFSG